MFHRITSVRPLPEYRLAVTFATGGTRRYDMRALIRREPAFSPLEDETLFRSVRLDAGGYGLSWNDSIDISCNELWENGVTVSGAAAQAALSPFPAPFRP